MLVRGPRLEVLDGVRRQRVADAAVEGGGVAECAEAVEGGPVARKRRVGDVGRLVPECPPDRLPERRFVAPDPLNEFVDPPPLVRLDDFGERDIAVEPRPDDVPAAALGKREEGGLATPGDPLPVRPEAPIDLTDPRSMPSR